MNQRSPALAASFNQPKYQLLIDILRSEIEEYGGLINLLDEQQERILKNDSEAVLMHKQLIDEQISVNTDLRNQRQNILTSIINDFKIEEEPTIKALLPYFPKNIQGLLVALVQEVTAQMERTQRKARQCQMLLSRVCEVTEDVIRMFKPHAITKTYDRQGSVSIKAGPDGSRMSTAV